MTDKTKNNSEVSKTYEVSASEIPQNATMRFTNDGSMVLMNRAARRKKYSLFPKSSQLRKKNKRKKK